MCSWSGGVIASTKLYAHRGVIPEHWPNRLFSRLWPNLPHVSHSKLERVPFEERAPQFKKWVVVCAACGRKGWSATMDVDAYFATHRMHPNWRRRFEEAYEVLPLDALGRCFDCAAAARISGYAPT